MEKVCSKCGWLWNEEQTPITENGIDYCPVCDNAFEGAKEIRVIILKAETDEVAIVQKFPHSLESMQAVVDGYVEPVRVTDSITIWGNETGKIDGLDLNFYLLGHDDKPLDIVVGDVLITGTDEEGETVSLTDEEIEEIKDRFVNRRCFKMFK